MGIVNIWRFVASHTMLVECVGRCFDGSDKRNVCSTSMGEHFSTV